MKLLAYPLLADENIDPAVVAWLRESGADVRTVFDDGLVARADVDILRHAWAQGRVVITHDSDFGTLAIRRGEPVFGLIYLRPGHRLASFTIDTLHAVDVGPVDAEPPFIAVVERRGAETRVRLRRPVGL